MLIASSAGVSAPIESPIGVWMRSMSASGKPCSASAVTMWVAFAGAAHEADVAGLGPQRLGDNGEIVSVSAGHRDHVALRAQRHAFAELRRSRPAGRPCSPRGSARQRRTPDDRPATTTSKPTPAATGASAAATWPAPQITATEGGATGSTCASLPSASFAGPWAWEVAEEPAQVGRADRGPADKLARRRRAGSELTSHSPGSAAKKVTARRGAAAAARARTPAQTASSSCSPGGT